MEARGLARGQPAPRCCPPGTAHFLPPTPGREVVTAALDEERPSAEFVDLLFCVHVSTYLFIQRPLLTVGTRCCVYRCGL